jgi:hypothetical protein
MSLANYFTNIQILFLLLTSIFNYVKFSIDIEPPSLFLKLSQTETNNLSTMFQDWKC